MSLIRIGYFQYIVIRSIVNTPTPLYLSGSPDIEWDMGAVNYTFPFNYTFPANGVVILLIGPDTSSFVPNYQVIPGIPLIVASSTLNTASEDIIIREPVSPGLYIDEEEVAFLPTAPWPVPATGQAITRISASYYSDDPSNWGLATCNPNWQICSVPTPQPSSPTSTPLTPTIPPQTSPTIPPQSSPSTSPIPPQITPSSSNSSLITNPGNSPVPAWAIAVVVIGSVLLIVIVVVVIVRLLGRNEIV